MQYESPVGGSDASAYIDPNQASGVQGSLVRAPAIENHQRELVNLIEAAGITPDRGDLTQVEQSVVALINAAIAAATLVAPGTLRISAANTPESGEFLCNGQAIDRVTYSALWSKLGGLSSPWGLGDGSTTFNLPDLRGRALVCAGQGSGLTLRSLGQTMGAETHALSIGEMPAHSHTVSASTASGDGSALEVAPTEGFTRNTSSVGSGTAHNNMQPSATINVFIHI